MAIEGALIGGIGSLASGLFGKSEAEKKREQEAAFIQKAVDELVDQGIPPVEAQRITLEKYRSEGLLSPEVEREILAGPTAFAGIEQDPTLRRSELDALSELERIGESGGMTLRDDANLNKVLAQTGARERGSREAALQRLAQQGNLGSGFELAASLDASQDAATQANQSGLDIAATAQERGLDALMRAGQTAGGIGERDFSRDARKAEAADALERFNAMGRRQVEASNVGRRQGAQEFNLRNAQRISDANVDVGNREQIYNKQLLQKDYENRMAKAGAVANAYNRQATAAGQAADREGAFYGGIGEGVGKLGSSISESQTKREAADEDYKRDLDFYERTGQTRRR